MAKFNPNMSKQDLVSAFSSKAPFLNSMSTDGAYNYIVKQYPQYKLSSEDTEYKPATQQDTNLWDSMPNFIKEGYNKSLQGMAY